MGPALFFCQNDAASKHRKLVIFNCREKPVLVRLLVMCIAALYWWLWAVWYRLALYAISSKADEISVSKWQQIKGLLLVCFWIGANPGAYRRLQLYRYPHSRWLYFVFPQEQLGWHQAHTNQNDKPPPPLMADKFAVEQKLNKASIAATRTLTRVLRGNQVASEDLFRKTDLFIKPNNANAMRGCARLEYDDKSGTYHLQGLDLQGKLVESSNPERIEDFVSRISHKHDLLLQEPLVNSDAIEQFCGVSTSLITLRVVTFISESGLSESTVPESRIGIAYALLEVPADDKQDWHLYPINADSGEVSPSAWLPNTAPDLTGTLPNWREVKARVAQAHSLFPYWQTLAWDLCITDRGVVVIEGNTGWSLVTPQVQSGIPLLETDLLDVYSAGAEPE